MNDEFFKQNDEQVCALMCRILLWMTLVYPVLFAASIFHIFKVSVPELLTILPLGLICTISPTILHKCGVKTEFLKLYGIISVGVFICVMASNSHIGIYITYCLALAFSCLYFDHRFTRKTAVICYFLLVIGVFFRSRNVEIYDGRTRMSWFIAYGLGYTIEYVAMSFVFVNVARRSRMLLENLQNTEHIGHILEQCGDASTNLSKLMKVLKSSINDTTDNNKNIEDLTTKTKEGCEYSLEQVNQTTTSINNMSDSMETINMQAQKLIEITQKSYDKTKNYIHIMERAVDSMKDIEASSNSIQFQINEVETHTNEISDFTQTISAIAAKTNILALNASIEAARAGDQGRGFAVVASQVGQLASATRDAAGSIAERISQMSSCVNEATSAVAKNSSAVKSGISEIVSAKEEAELLLTYQDESNTKVQEVESTLKDSVAYQANVSRMAQSMDEVTNHSLEQVESILTALTEQNVLTQNMQDAYLHVQEISDELLTISKKDI